MNMSENLDIILEAIKEVNRKYEQEALDDAEKVGIKKKELWLKN